MNAGVEIGRSLVGQTAQRLQMPHNRHHPLLSLPCCTDINAALHNTTLLGIDERSSLLRRQVSR